MAWARSWASSPAMWQAERYFHAPHFSARRRGHENCTQCEPDRGLANRQCHQWHGGYGVRPCVVGQGTRQDIRLRARRHGAAQPPGHDCRRAVGRCGHRHDVARTRLMFAPLLGAIRADIDRQVGWAKDEVVRQTRYATLTGVLAGAAALAALGAIVVGLIALYLWLSMQADPFIALGMIGGGLLLLAALLFALAFIRRRPRLAVRPQLQIARPAALLGTLRSSRYDRIVAGGEPTLKLATDTLRHGPRSALLGTLVLVAIAGLIAGRRSQLPRRQTIDRRH